MGKRSDGFEPRERGFYETPQTCIDRISPWFRDVRGFAEVCCGDGAMIRHLERLGHRCVYASDVEPMTRMAGYAARRDARSIQPGELAEASHIITNPPWPRPRANGSPTLEIIHHCMNILPTWLLLQADFAHNRYAPPVLAHCHRIVSIGRVKWIPGSKHDSVDNCAWYLFDATTPRGATEFWPRPDEPAAYHSDIEALL